MERSRPRQGLHDVLAGVTYQQQGHGRVADRVKEYESSLSKPIAGRRPPVSNSAPSTPTRQTTVSASAFHDARAILSASRGQAVRSDSSSMTTTTTTTTNSSSGWSHAPSTSSAARTTVTASSGQSSDNAHVQVAHRVYSQTPRVIQLLGHAQPQQEQQQQQGPAALQRRSATNQARPRAATVTERPVAVETAEQRTQRINRDFVQLLDSMQLPNDGVRQRMMTLTLGMKEEMLRSSSRVAGPGHARPQSMNEPAPSPNSLKRRTKSSASLSSSSMGIENIAPASPKKQRSRANSASSLFRSLGRSTKTAPPKPETPVAAVVPARERDTADWLELISRPAAAIDPADVRVLRVRLRNESPAWIERFVREGGYQLLLDRFDDLYRMEWREEQHDDQLLDALLRCFVALTLTAVGKRALASQSPTPFVQMADLMFSEKRPGDLPCRQLLVEMLLALFSINPANARAVTEWPSSSLTLTSEASRTANEGPKRYVRPAKGAQDEDEGEVSIERRIHTHSFVRSLMIGPPDEQEESKVDFIKGAHQPRIFKRWVRELASTANDYFWIFCHKGNLFWALQCIDERAIDTPTVPTGMTGGVEHEAMQYCTRHLKMLNALVQSAPNMEAAFRLHHDLFMSGFERVLMTLRRSSTSFYPLLHLEMARYIHLARSARFNLGPLILSSLDARVLSEPERTIVEQYQAHLSRYQTPSGAPQLALDL